MSVPPSPSASAAQSWARWARWTFALPAATLAITAALGAALRLHALRPDGVLPEPVYASCSAAHAGLGGSAVALLAVLVWSPRTIAAVHRGRDVVLLALGLVVLSVIVPALGPITAASTAYALPDGRPLLSALGLAMASAVAARRDVATVALGVLVLLLLAQGALGLVIAAEGGPVLVSQDVGPVTSLVTIVALVSALEPAATSGAQRGALALSAALLATAPLSWWANVPELAIVMMRLPVLGAFAAIVLSVRASRASTVPVAQRAALVLATIAATGAVIVDSLVVLADPMALADTTLPTGVLHLRLVAIGCAAAAGSSSWGRSRPALAAVITFAVGGATFAAAIGMLGARGLPTRYARYTDDFGALQQIASVGALVALIGVAAMIVAALRAPAADGAERVSSSS